MEWHKANSWKPYQRERVLLKIKHEDCPVVGYWGCGGWEACTVNVEVKCGAWCQGGLVEKNFKSEEVSTFRLHHECSRLNALTF